MLFSRYAITTQYSRATPLCSSEGDQGKPGDNFSPLACAEILTARDAFMGTKENFHFHLDRSDFHP